MGTLVTTYPIGEEREMVRIVRYEGISNRPVYVDRDGQEWVMDLSQMNPWFSKVKVAKQDKENE